MTALRMASLGLITEHFSSLVALTSRRDALIEQGLTCWFVEKAAEQDWRLLYEPLPPPKSWPWPEDA